MDKKGLVHVYTGDGKGKTTAALGLALRARGHGLKVAFVYFHKDPERWGNGELKILKKIGVDTFEFARKHPRFCNKLAAGEVRKECLKGLRLVEGLYKKRRYDIIILDEINISLKEGFLRKGALLDILRKKPPCVELVLTGRGAPAEILRRADLVSKIEKVAHPYDSGVPARRGIEY